jgi:tripartite-type tricarboxylate transporter receptor subunit TctC
LRLAAGAAALPAVPRLAMAQVYPAHPLRFVVGFAPGSAPDIIARLIGQALSDRLGQQLIIENRPGAASNIATEAALNAPTDGYTLLMVVLTNVLNATLYPNLKYDFMRDAAPVDGIANAPYLVVVTPSLPVKSIPELIAYAKANPGKINMASGGNGSSSHIFGELLKKMAGIDMLHVPYRTNYMSDLLAGQVHLTINPIPQAMEQVRAGKLRALAITTAKRLPSLPEIPTMTEFVPGYEAVGWYGLCVRRGTPSAFVGKLNGAMNAALADSTIKSRLATLGVEPMPMTPAEFGAFMRHDFEKWADVIKSAGIKLD